MGNIIAKMPKMAMESRMTSLTLWYDIIWYWNLEIDLILEIEMWDTERDIAGEVEGKGNPNGESTAQSCDVREKQGYM